MGGYGELWGARENMEDHEGLQGTMGNNGGLWTARGYYRELGGLRGGLQVLWGIMGGYWGTVGD